MNDFLKQSPGIKSLMARCYGNTKVYAKVVHPERFNLPFSAIHDEIFKILDDDSIQKAVIAAPRGFGKTSCVNMAYPAKKILFREKKFIVPVGCTATQAIMQSENLKRELETNPMVKELFGPMRSGSFAKDSWITSTGTMVLPRGSGQQIRGILHGDSRPDLILCDDLEDPEAVRSEEQRAKLKEWFFADVCNSINRSRSDWKIVVVGTVLHEDSLLVNLLNDPTWHSVRLEICDDNYNSNWPDMMNNEQVKALAESYAAQGLLDVFFREYRNMPISTHDATFRQEYFKYYDETSEGLDKNQFVENVVIIDPAKTVKLHSAESAIIGIGVNVVENKIYIRDLVADKFYPDQLYDEAFKMVARLDARVLAVEVTSLHEFISYPIKNEIVFRKSPVEYVELSARGKKEDRIAQLVPFYRQGRIYHNKAVCMPLESQLMAFPRCARFDCIDAEAYIIYLLEEGSRYFQSSEEASDDEYKDLDDEDAVEDWRIDDGHLLPDFGTSV